MAQLGRPKGVRNAARKEWRWLSLRVETRALDALSTLSKMDGATKTKWLENILIEALERRSAEGAQSR